MNLWQTYRALTARDRQLNVVTVVSVNSDGTSTVQTQAGASFKVFGTTVDAGHKAVIKAGQVISEASDLPTYSVTV